jgi:hypothetical protein
MKEQLQNILTEINNTFDYSNEAFNSYKKLVENALQILQSLPRSSNLMLENWRTIGIEEIEKELKNRLSDNYLTLHPDQQHSEFKFSKSKVSMTLTNILMHL